MIENEFIQNQKKVIESDIKRLDKEVASNSKFEDIGSNNEDSALEYESFEEKLALNKTAEKDLGELKAALKQIENGTYGICKKCGQEIERGRLKAYPAATYCVTHAQKK